MKIFIISLKRSVERRASIESQFKALGMEFEFIDAVDGQDMDEGDIRACTSDSFYNEYVTKPWITEGVVAAGLSHRKAYKRIIDDNLDYALIMEDDVILSPEFPVVLEKIEGHLHERRLITFFVQTYIPDGILEFETKSRIALEDGSEEHFLYLPTQMKDIGSAAAYIMSNYTARRNYNTQNPVRSCPDWWIHFINNENFNEMRFVHPLILKPGEFATTINYPRPYRPINVIKRFLARLPFFRGRITDARRDRFGQYMNYKFV